MAFELISMNSFFVHGPENEGICRRTLNSPILTIRYSYEIVRLGIGSSISQEHTGMFQTNLLQLSELIPRRPRYSLA